MADNKKTCFENTPKSSSNQNNQEDANKESKYGVDDRRYASLPIRTQGSSRMTSNDSHSKLKNVSEKLDKIFERNGGEGSRSISSNSSRSTFQETDKSNTRDLDAKLTKIFKRDQ